MFVIVLSRKCNIYNIINSTFKMDSYESEDLYMQEAQRKAKQSFLREEILEMNYSPELFTMFLFEKGSVDVDEWSFEDLQDSIREFKQHYRPGETLESVEKQRRIEREKEEKLYHIPKTSASIDSDQEGFRKTLQFVLDSDSEVSEHVVALDGSSDRK